jgi:hypothetical protein
MKRFIMMACFGLVLFGGVFATEARAGTCTVNALTDTGAGSGGVNGAGDLRYCIEQAEFAGGDNVINVIVTGTLMLNSPLVITHHPYNSSPATLIINGSGQSSFFIDGSNITPMSNGLAAAFRIATPAPLNVTINNLTVQNCNSHAGGGAMSIYGYSVSAYLNYVTIANNTLATGGGGAIQAYNSNLYISNSRITGNRTNYGGGGGIHISTQYIPNGNGRRLHITDSTISGNSASHEYDGGGGISSTVDNTEIQNSTISGNNAISGGGIYLTSINAKFSNVTISDNSGGGIYHNYRYARLTLRNCTIAGNTWTSYGAGIRTEGARTVLANTIIAYNSGRSYDGNPEQEYPVDSPPEVHGTNIFTTPFNRFIGGPGTILIADPLLNPLADNGGLTQTRSLRPGSPAIDTGLNSVALYPNGTPLQTDQRGEGFARIWGASVDVGAFEKGVISFSPDTLPPGSQNVPYSQQITAVGESAPFTLSVESGSLPTGFTLSSGGLLSGTTAQRGTFSFAVRATDTTGYFVVKNYVLYIGHIVTNANSSGAGSLRQLINDTPAGGTILFDTTFFNQPRTIPLNDGVLNIFKNLTITGPGANLLTLDGVNSTRVFGIDGGVTLNLSGVRITRGYNDHCGGGIINNGGSTLNAANIIIDNSRSDNGGGGICNVGTLNLTGSLITGNTAANEGGGIRNNPGNTVNITNSTLSNNQASNWNGGGVSNNGTLNVFGSTLSGNTSPNGGGVYAGGISIINNSTLSGNAAISGAGGAAYISSGSRLDTTNTTITNNVSSSNQIGGIFNQGLYQTRNSIIAGNRNANGTGNGDLNGDIASYGWNLFGNTFGTSIGSSGTGGQTLTGNLYNVAANLAPLGNYGGATETHALLSNSPAINAGDPNGSFTTDQRGSPRPIGGRGDIGSFERDITFEQNNLPAAVLGRNYNETLTVSRQANLSIAALFLRQSDTARLSARSVDSGKTASPQDDPLARVLPGAMNKLSFTTASSDPLLGVLQPNSNLTALFNFSIITINGQGLPPGLSLSSNGLISGLPTASGNYAFTIKATDADGMAGVQTFAILVNTAPTISDIADQTIFSSAPTSALAFTVSDPETPVTSLTVSGTSSNQTLIPNSNIVFGGADTNRTVTITPAANQIGSATITVTVTDSGGASTSVSFALTVLNRLPTISAIPDQTTDEDTPTGALAFTVGDAETSAGSLVVTTTSSNQALVPNSGITLAGAGGANRTIQLMPSADQNGTTTITLTVTDANGAMAQGVFDLAVNPANDAPTFAKGAGQIIDEDAGARTVNNWATNISAGPPDEAGQTLAFSLSIAGTTGGLTFSSAPAISAATGALSYTSAPDSNGTATISVTLSDNGSNAPPQQNTSAAQTFTITVNPVNDAPTISGIADLVTNEGTPIAPIAFTVGDVETLAVDLSLSGSSSNQTLVPNANIAFGGTGASRTITISPVAGQIGTTTITVTVTDADGGTASKSFALTVQLPVILVTNGNDAGTGSLRQAIVDVSDGGTINFAPNVNLITLTSGQIQLGRSVTINGPGANQLTVSGNHTSRVFEVSVDAPAVVTISGLTIANGNVAGWMDEGGGGILKNNDGTLNIVDCAFTNNFSPYIGGGISVTHYHPGSGGAVNITGSTFSGNSTGAYGGAIYLLRGSLTVASSTISGNSSGEYGGGISTGDYGNFFADNGRISLANSTVTNNSAYYCGGIVNPAQREFNLRNNIIAQNNGTEWAPDLCESYRTQGYNLIGSSQGAYFTGPTNLDLRNQNSRLAPLGNNGGATQTHALLADSPALDAGNDCVLTANGCGDNNPALTTDQRGPGFPRQAGTAVDIGAFEAIAYSVSATAGTPQTALLNHAFATPLQATVTASGAPQSGVEVTFTAPASGASATFAGGSHTSTVTTDSQGVATAPTLTANSTAGSYQVTASANEHSATFSLTNAAGDQTITFDPLPNRTYGDEPFTLNAAASSGLPVSFSASGQCSLSGTTVQLTGAGACAITASQSGNDNYQAAPNVERTFSIGKANSTTIITVSDATYNGNPQGGTATVTGVGGLNQSLTVTYTGRNTTTYGPTTTVPANAGEYTASASYEGDDDHHGSGDSQPFTIARATATITLGNLTRTYDGAGQTVTATTDPAGLNVSLTYSQSSQPVATPTNAGSYVVTGQINEANYEGGMTGTFVINKATPVITWSSPSDITQGTALSSAQLNATANVPGEFAYTPPASTVLNAGHSQTLSATFTPTDTTNYDPAFAEVSINVLTAPGAIAGQVTHDGAPIAGLTVALSGTAPAVTTTDAFGTYSFANLAIGDYTVNVAAHPHYNFTPASRAFNLTSGQTISDAHFAALSTLSNPQPAGGSVLISEFRPAGETEDDEFIELYNNSDSAVDISNYTVAISGYLLGIPAGTILPARTHYLIAHASGYSLTGVVPADQTYDGFELPTEAGLALVAPGGVIMDAAGFTSAPASCREGEGIAAPALSQGQYSFARRYRHGLTQDTGDNAADFMLVSTDPAATGGSLGSPGPESTTSHIQKNLAEIVSQLIDPGVSPSTSPNRTRDAGAYADVQTPSAPGGGAPASNPYALGTLSIQRRFINNTERSVTRLRFRVVDITTAPDGVGTVADVRLLTSDGVTRAPAAVPAGVLLSGARLEQPPAQRFGGGYNSSVTVDLSATPNGRLLPGEWVDVQFLLGVAKGGTFRFFVVIEAVQSQ